MNRRVVQTMPGLDPNLAREIGVRRSIRGKLSAAIRKSILNVVDRGCFGLTPLKMHIVICGFPRSGSTLLNLMVRNCVSDLKYFDDEVWALEAARHSLRNHAYMVTKRPRDIFLIDEIRKVYSRRRTDVRFSLTMRDPRDILTSIHNDHRDMYYVSSDRWKADCEQFRRAQEFPDVMVIRFEDLVTRTEQIERRLALFTGWHQTRPLRLFYEEMPDAFELKALNDLRPLDTSVIGKWRQSVHAERIRQVLTEIPSLPEYLIELGYENDTRWSEPYLSSYH